MASNIILIYDGECPFCNKFAQLVELQKELPSLSIKNGRDNISELSALYRKGYDLDEGAILILDDEILHGYSAVHWICSQIKEPTNSLLNIITSVFSSKNRSETLFPLLIFSRRLILSFKGVSRKLIKDKNLLS